MSRGTSEAWFPDDLCPASPKICFASPSSLGSPIGCPPELLQSHQPEPGLCPCLSVRHVFLGLLLTSFQSDPNFYILPLAGLDFHKTGKTFQWLSSLPITQKSSRPTKGLNSCWGTAVRQLCGQTDSMSASLFWGARLKILPMIHRYCDFQSTAGECGKGASSAER